MEPTALFWRRPAARPAQYGLEMLTSQLERETLEIFRFRNCRNHRMVGRLGINGGAAQGAPCIAGRLKNHRLEYLRAHVVRAAERGQRAARLEQLERAQ